MFCLLSIHLHIHFFTKYLVIFLVDVGISIPSGIRKTYDASWSSNNRKFVVDYSTSNAYGISYRVKNANTFSSVTGTIIFGVNVTSSISSSASSPNISVEFFETTSKIVTSHSLRWNTSLDLSNETHLRVYSAGSSLTQVASKKVGDYIIQPGGVERYTLKSLNTANLDTNFALTANATGVSTGSNNYTFVFYFNENNNTITVSFGSNQKGGSSISFTYEDDVFSYTPFNEIFFKRTSSTSYSSVTSLFSIPVTNDIPISRSGLKGDFIISNNATYLFSNYNNNGSNQNTFLLYGKENNSDLHARNLILPFSKFSSELHAIKSDTSYMFDTFSSNLFISNFNGTTSKIENTIAIDNSQRKKNKIYEKSRQIICCNWK